MQLKSFRDYVELKQGLAINKGTDYLISNVKDSEFCIPLLRIADMVSGTFSKYVSNKVNPNVIASNSDIIYTRTGQIGLVFTDYTGVVHNNSFIVSIKKEKEMELDKAYLFTVLNSDFVRKQAMSLAHSSVQPDLTHEMFKNMCFPLPDIKEQERIAEIYASLTKKINNNMDIVQMLESMAKTLYDYWFVQFDFPNENGHPYKTSGGKMEWNETLSREIPAGWEVGRLADYCSLQRGVTYGKGDSTNIPQDGYEPILRANNIQNHELNFDSLVYLPKKLINEKQYLKNGDILIAMSSGSMEHIGKVARVFYDLNYGFGAFCSKITPLKDIGKQYVYYYVISDEFQLYIHNMCLGTNIRNLTNDHILNSKLCKIPEKILSQFESKMAPIHKKQALLKQENINLSYIRDFLLPMLMNGQVTFRQ